MKIKNKKNSKKVIVISSIALVVLMATGASAYHIIKNDSDSQKDSSFESEEVKTNSGQSENSDESSKTDRSTTNTDQPAPTTIDESTGKTIVQMVSSADISGGVVYIRGGINNSVEYDGTCYAQLTGPGNESIRKETTLLQNAATTDCKTIQINTSELSKGIWKFVLIYQSNEVEGSSDEGSFEIS